VKVCARFQKLQPANHQLQVFQKSKTKHKAFRLFDPTLPYIVSPDKKNGVFHADLLVSTAAMSWANPVVASLALGDVVPGKMKGLVLKLGHVGINKTTRW